MTIPNPNLKTLFLDFDGVLHGEGKQSTCFFEHMSAFCAAIRPYRDHVQLVISSSWREERILDALRALFDPDIGTCLVGVTPVHDNTYGVGIREQEIRSYCARYGITDWLALDDQRRFFSPNCPHLLIIDGQVGLSLDNLAQVQAFLHPTLIPRQDVDSMRMA